MTGTTEGMFGGVAAAVVIAGDTAGAGEGVTGGETGVMVVEGKVEECAGATGEVAAGVAKDEVDGAAVGVELRIAVGVAVVVISGVTIGIAVGVAA